jgi:hypothetical protein
MDPRPTRSERAQRERLEVAIAKAHVATWRAMSLASTLGLRGAELELAQLAHRFTLIGTGLMDARGARPAKWLREPGALDDNQHEVLVEQWKAYTEVLRSSEGTRRSVWTV